MIVSSPLSSTYEKSVMASSTAERRFLKHSLDESWKTHFGQQDPSEQKPLMEQKA